MNNMVISNLIDTMANIEYGILIAIVIVVALLFGIASVNSRNKLNVLSYIIALILLVPLAFQMSRLVGACHVSDAVSEFVTSASGPSLGWFIFRRIMWSVLFIAIAGFCICTTMDRKRSRGRSTPSGIQTGRRYSSSTSRRRR